MQVEKDTTQVDMDTTQVEKDACESVTCHIESGTDTTQVEKDTLGRVSGKREVKKADSTTVNKPCKDDKQGGC